MPLGVRPRPPMRPAQRSEMMSPYRLGITITSNWLGRVTICGRAGAGRAGACGEAQGKKEGGATERPVLQGTAHPLATPHARPCVRPLLHHAQSEHAHGQAAPAAVQVAPTCMQVLSTIISSYSMSGNRSLTSRQHLRVRG